MMVESLCQNGMFDQSIGLFNSARRSGTAAISDSSVLIFFRSLIKFNYVEGFLVSFKEICQLLKVLPGYLYLKKYGCNFKKWNRNSSQFPSEIKMIDWGLLCSVVPCNMSSIEANIWKDLMDNVKYLIFLSS